MAQQQAKKADKGQFASQIKNYEYNQHCRLLKNYDKTIGMATDLVMSLNDKNIEQWECPDAACKWKNVGDLKSHGRTGWQAPV